MPGEPRQVAEEAYLSALTYQTLYTSVLDRLQSKTSADVGGVRSALQQAESAAPGFLLCLTKALVAKSELGLNLEEAFLRLQAQAPAEDFALPHPEAPFQDLSTRAVALRRILARIPDEISDRRAFLEIIKEIASSIKKLLDATNNIYHLVPLNAQGSVERRKKEFVSRSKRFSNTLKEYFKDREMEWCRGRKQGQFSSRPTTSSSTSPSSSELSGIELPSTDFASLLHKYYRRA